LKRGFRIAGGVLVALLFGGGILAAHVLVPQKAFTVPRVAVEATLDANGTMHVVEHITYDFTGTFSFGTRPIPVGAYTISDMTVSEHGTALVSTGAPYNLQWYFTAENEKRTFDIAYTVTGAAVGAPDVAAVYWKWVGTEHPTIGQVTATLHVPPGDGRLRAWGHGPLTGNVTVGADTVRWEAPDVPTGTFVEGRVTIPASRMPALAPTAPPQLDRILAEEGAWAKAANDTRAKAAQDAARERDARAILTVLAPILTVLGGITFLFLWRRFGKEPAPPQPVSEYVRDLPDDPPAVVVGLMHWGTLSPAAFSATVLDLAQRGFLTVKEVRIDRALLADRVDYEMTATEADRTALKAFERTTLEQVFASGSPVMQSEISKYSRAHQSEALARWNSFKADASTSLRNRKYINGHRSKPFLLNIGAAILVGLAGVGALGLRLWVVGGIAIAGAGLQLALTPLLRQRSPEGHQRFLEWKGVAKYLHDFSQLADAPVGHLILWERYLVYAAALGVSEQLAEGLAARIPPEEQANFAPWYVGMHPGAGYSSIGDFSSGIATSTSSFSPPSSSSGGGGGFSGGGGGGGGGGGIGAG
jgi:Predicted membrane protein